MDRISLILRYALICVFSIVALAVEAADAPAEFNGADWDVRVEVAMVSMPQELALSLLPDLRDSKKIGGAVERLLAAIQRKEATLTGHPIVQTRSGQRSVAQSQVEFRYPTEFKHMSLPQNGIVPSATPPPATVAVPTNWETRPTGVIFEVEPTVSGHGTSVFLNLQCEHGTLQRMDSFDVARHDNGEVSKVDQPRFTTNRVTTSLTVRSGEWCLLAIHNVPEPAGYLEIFIVQAVAIGPK